MKHRRQKSIALLASVLLAFAGVFAASHSTFQRVKQGIEARSACDTREVRHADSRVSDAAVFEPRPQASSFDLLKSVIAGGGGRSSGGSPNVTLNGTIGQSAAGTTSSGGQFTVTDGFWNAEATQTPTPTPTPTATPTPPPTPPPNGPTIFVEQGTSLLVAVDSVTFVRGPFMLSDDHNFSTDHRTRIVFFTTSLGFAQPSQPSGATLSVEVGGFSVPVERVGPSSFAGVDASYIVFRLPDLPPGDWPLSIRLQGILSNNSPILRIAASPTGPG